MANDIGNFFKSQPNRDDAIAGIANHIRSYWTPKMREKLIAAELAGDAELDELPRAAVVLLATTGNQPTAAPVGGDAG
jgi:formate dehydrogenase subunit delta